MLLKITKSSVYQKYFNFRQKNRSCLRTEVWLSDDATDLHFGDTRFESRTGHGLKLVRFS
jgi:hypothetical protein